MPTLCVLLHQRELVWMFVVSKADVKRLHLLVGHEPRMVGATGRDVDFV
jgi:hypothetical protein